MFGPSLSTTRQRSLRSRLLTRAAGLAAGRFRLRVDDRAPRRDDDVPHPSGLAVLFMVWAFVLASGVQAALHHLPV